jgi:phenylalanyl-tRNA synthetase beta chain
VKVTYNWLKDFVEIKIPAKQLADKLTMAGLEVTSLEEKEGDFVFELEITANRSDLLSVVGIAREVAAITGKKMWVGSRLAVLGSRLPGEYRTPNTEHRNLKIKIENKKDCPLYTAKIIRDVKVRSSPEWLKKRLELVGCRSVNNIVDITNYILFTWGEPLHAFDLDRLTADKIIVRRAKNNEKIVTINEEERMLNSDVLVIADKEKPVAIAGIMGGKDTEVAEKTKNILLEAAIFNPVIIRRARRNLGLQSESAYRFERGIDFQSVENASWQAIRLIQELTGARCVLAKSSGLSRTFKKVRDLPKIKRKVINLEVVTVQKILGINIAPAKIKQILNHLDFKIKIKSKNIFLVQIPSHRLDVHLEIDLIEEIARIFGYAQIPKTLPPVAAQISADPLRDLVSFTKNILVGLGLSEVITYGLTDKEWSKATTEAIEILNPLSQEQAILRPTLMPSLCRCVADNLKAKQAYINIFEIAKTFKAGEKIQEAYTLGVALCGIRPLWFSQGRIQDEAGFLHLKGILEMLFSRLGIAEEEYKFETCQADDYIAIYVQAEKIGHFQRLSEEILDTLEIKNKAVFVAELVLEKLLSYIGKEKRFVSLPRFPEVSRDISLILKEDIPAEKIVEVIKKTGGELLEEVKITDYYCGKQIPAGFKGITLSCLYRSEKRTLTEDEINPLHTQILARLKERFAAQLRT